MNKRTLDRELWRAIESFEIDEVRGGRGPERTFEARLAEEQGWSREFAARVVAEYRRFVYLASAGHSVTPSEAVDEAWHLHLMYTRSYWDRMCGRVLKKPLHHEPSRGGAAEEGKYADQYGETLKLYREVFGEEAPGDVWPRGGGESDERGVRSEESEARKRRRQKVLSTAGILGVVTIIGSGCVGNGASNVLPLMMVVGFALLFIVVLLKGMITAIGSGGPRRRGGQCGYDGMHSGIWPHGGSGDSGGSAGMHGAGMVPDGTGHSQPSHGHGHSHHGHSHHGHGHHGHHDGGGHHGDGHLGDSGPSGGGDSGGSHGGSSCGSSGGGSSCGSSGGSSCGSSGGSSCGSSGESSCGSSSS